MSNMTLKRLRQLAPEEDRNSEALAPRPAPLRYTGPGCIPRANTLRQLQQVCGERGRWAAANAQWHAVYQWLRASRQGELAVSSVALLAGAAARQMKGWDSGLEAKDRTELKELGTLAAACRDGWRRVGQPFLLTGIRNAQRFAEECDRMERHRAAERAGVRP